VTLNNQAESINLSVAKLTGETFNLKGKLQFPKVVVSTSFDRTCLLAVRNTKALSPSIRLMGLQMFPATYYSHCEKYPFRVKLRHKTFA